MNTQPTSATRRGFTLMELMVAMAITTIIVTVLVSITSIALDTWNRSRSELRASRQAKGMIDSMARDFEALVTRRGNTNEWLSAISAPPNGGSTNAAKLIFFTAATDRYNGELAGKDQIAGNGDDPPGGDVSCVSYQLEYRDPISGGSSNFETFVLYRMLVDPKPTFSTLLGEPDLPNAFGGNPLRAPNSKNYAAEVTQSTNFLSENVFQFTVTFHVQVTDTAKNPPVFNVPVTMGDSTEEFRIRGTGITTDYTGPSAALVPSGRVTAVEISATVISDFGVDQLKRRKFSGSQQAEFLAKNSYQYTKLVQIPTM